MPAETSDTMTSDVDVENTTGVDISAARKALENVEHEPGASKPDPIVKADNVVNTTDQVADLPLGEATDGVTQPVDEAVGGALNEVGGAVGQPDLGGQVGGAVEGATGGLLP